MRMGIAIARREDDPELRSMLGRALVHQARIDAERRGTSGATLETMRTGIELAESARDDLGGAGAPDLPHMRNDYAAALIRSGHLDLVDEENDPVQGAPSEITVPTGKVEHGRLDTEGQAKYSKLQYEGECTVRFPEYDQGAVAAVSGRRKAPTHWLELEFVDEDNQPVPDAAYQVEFPDGRVEQGELDSKGLARFTELQKGGDCTVTFPEFDQSALVKA